MIGILAQISPLPTEPTALSLLMKGGVVMIPIAILWCTTVYIFIERYLYLKQRTKTKNDFVKNVIRIIKESDVRAASIFAERENSSTGKIINTGIHFIGKPVREIEMMMEAVANIEVGEMEKNTGYLGIIAGVAPMLGFIGTISGIIHIFYNISLTDNISIGIISGGLYEKMITSGTGLIVGVSAYAAYHFIHQEIQNFSLRVQRDSFDFIRYIISPAE